MIYTITFNPAIDYVMHLDSFRQGDVNRSRSEELFFGGKGINVSIVLKRLGVKSVAMGFLAGFTGEAIEKGVNAQGIETDFVHLKSGSSRINVKIKSDAESEINGQGPDISADDVDKLYGKLELLKAGDILILAGSIPSSLPSNIYENILARLSGRGILCIVDATKALLLNVLKYHPFLVKPNNFELGELFSRELKNDDEIIDAAKQLRHMGAENVLVSMAENGAVLVDENDHVHRMGAASGKIVNSVGAGDSMLAGFAAGYFSKKDYRYALELGTACGGATTFSSGLAEGEDIQKLLVQLQHSDIYSLIE